MITTKELEKSVVQLIGVRKHAIVPNISWGLGLSHECDLLCLDEQNRFTEIELKVSRSDLRADFKKEHGHQSKIISRLVYAFPCELLELGMELIPKDCGIITANRYNLHDYSGKITGSYVAAEWYRTAKHNENRPSEKHINKFYRLGMIRLWK